ncbi:Amino acid ABC transporter substrate binding protein [Candidatus Promineifilum breve]|uniref:Amino acid ABC transporter substrate binding protein n=1 Tax=Candidatus Promineifilum breve TaxID=1806508 RepID=A0A160T1N5_9CHLR|nr:transporter substrate-binding domain-containing protein [Candidatus Promineifilum breve]CUS02435.2 Amino acid ABC transporter substrate binding protein [Candidatus Promineifilum breve]
MWSKRFALLFVLLMTLAMVACGGGATEPAAEPEAETAAETGATSELPDLGGREITVTLENAYLPFNYIDPATGEPAGWDYEAIGAICELLNCTPVFVESAWEGMIQAVADGQFDMAADGITITEERRELVDFSDGFINIEQRLLARIDEDRFDSVDSFVDNSDLTVGTQTGTTNFETISELVPAERIQAFDSFSFAVQSLLAGDVDAVIIDETAGLGYQGANAEALKLVGDSLSSDQLGFVFPKGSDLVAPFNAAMAALRENGTLARLAEKYFTDAFTLTYEDLE